MIHHIFVVSFGSSEFLNFGNIRVPYLPGVFLMPVLFYLCKKLTSVHISSSSLQKIIFILNFFSALFTVHTKQYLRM